MRRRQGRERAAHDIVVGERGVERLLLIGVAHANRERELVGQVQRVVREQRPVAAVLLIAVVDLHAPQRQRCRRAQETTDGGIAREGRAGETGQRIGVARIVCAISEVVVQRQIFIGEIAADEPIKLIPQRIALQPDFLREGGKLLVRRAIILAVQNVEVVEVRILPTQPAPVAIGGDRGQLGAAQIII